MNDSNHYNALISWLQNPENYPAEVESVQLIETHISAVFLTGEWAYKLKKPVNFGFLNFSQASQRKHFCELELTLNQRTAPQIYHSVVPVYQSSQNPTVFSFDVQPGLVEVDTLVKMRQFDPSNVLSRYLKDHRLSQTQIEQLAQAIVDLHQQAEPVQPGDFLGSPTCVLQPMTDNFPSLLSLLDQAELAISDANIQPEQIKTRLKQLQNWTLNQHTLLAPLIEQRQAEGHVRACHGDLHLDNITLYQGEPLLFDGIEFNDQFRWIDTLSDLAFLLTDLDYRQQQALSQQLLNLTLQNTGDYAGLVLLRFYQTYRALVRAKITGLRYLQLDPKTQEAKQGLESLLTYITLAESYAYLQNNTPCLYIMQGVSGSGKSYYANQVHQQTGAIIISSDRERKRLFGIAPAYRVDEQQKQHLYSQEMNIATYDRLYQSASAALQAGLNTLVDATFLKASHRQRFLELAEALNAKALIISIQPDAKQAEKLIQQRQQQNTDPSDANAQVMRRQLMQFEPPLDHEPALIIGMQSALPKLHQ
ncbi:bifunctional aminoglycoside phosphotransferase/ATP-binding protein [Thiomicrospira microaerophila]|uniref:bifunctional aminoglycoside phosphotransferase/ATP-binding protein n=1 Tax=Thiomicrospira microaerophila TaxID=406020 RepID=UPI0005C92AFB|nr:bifunctional aminoglycoside phosphotransferase/ATP-binding protein [Thiomicrospira microaerophila]